MEAINRNEEKYKEIDRKRYASPAKPLTQLCRDVGVSYQSYYNWFKKHNKQEETETPHKLRVAVLISLRELAQLIANEVQTLPMDVASVVRSLSPEDRGKLAKELGELQIAEAYLSRQQTAPKPSV